MAVAVEVTGVSELLAILENLSAGVAEASRAAVTVGSALPYAPFVEYGTVSHVIEATNARALRWEAAGGVYFARSVQHPGTKPNPFLENALDAAAAGVGELVNEAITEIATGGPVASVTAAIQKAGELVQATAQAKAPVRTGALRDSISVALAGL